MVNQNVEKRMISFINTAADRCRHCLRKSPTTCEKCESSWAQSIMTDILATATENTPDYSLAYRMKLIRTRLQHANRPLLASEIHLDGLCSMQLKYWTLRYMVRKGVLIRTVAFRRGQSRKKYYRYFLRKKKQGDNKK
jgi:hypothetical protein